MSVPSAPQGKSRGRALIGPIFGIVIIVAAAVVWFLNRDDATNAEVGDCIREEGSDELTIVDCDDPSAQWEVVGIESEEQTYDEFMADPDTCSAFSEAEQAWWYGEVGEEGLVLCVIPVN